MGTRQDRDRTDRGEVQRSFFVMPIVPAAQYDCRPADGSWAVPKQTRASPRQIFSSQRFCAASVATLYLIYCAYELMLEAVAVVYMVQIYTARILEKPRS